MALTTLAMHSSWRKHNTVVVILLLFNIAGCGKVDLQLENPADHARIETIAPKNPIIQPRFFSDLPSSRPFERLEPNDKYDDGKDVREKLVRFEAESFKKFVDEWQKESDLGHKTPVSLDLFDDTQLEVEITRVDRFSSDRLNVVGRINGDDTSKAILVLRNDSLWARVESTHLGERFDIRPVGEGAHVIRSIAGEEDAIVAPPAESEGDEAGDTESAPHDGAILISAGTPIIDMLVAYTPKARAKAGGKPAMVALIQRGVADINAAFEDSGANARVRLVGTLETEDNETGNFTRDLSSLQRKNDGRFDEVHAERDRVKADQVSLVGAYASSSSRMGTGFIDSHADSAFTVVKMAGFSQYTLAHELGHNLGLAHSDGFHNHKGRFRTIMAYGRYPRICRFSNPTNSFDGYSTGDRQHNEAVILSKNARKLAGFR